MNNEKLKEFFGKLNNSYVITAICAILVGVILLGCMIGLVAKPFATNTTYTAKVETKLSDETYTTKAKLTLFEDGRYSVTINRDKQFYTYFGDYGYGKAIIDSEEGKYYKIIWFEYDGEMQVLDAVLFGGKQSNLIEQKNPFKLQYGDVTFTNVGGILLLVCYCAVIAVLAAMAAILLVKRENGTIVFTDKMRLIKRLAEIEKMLGVTHD